MLQNADADVNDTIWRELSTLYNYDEGMRDTFAHGLPIYFVESDTPQGLLLKQCPDSRMELVKHRRGGDEVVQTLGMRCK